MFIHMKLLEEFMKNIYKLIWSDEALKGLKNIFDYLECKFSKKDIQKFAKKLDKQLDILQKSPETFSYSDNSKKVRRTIIAKLTSVYYQIEGNEVRIISIFDNRQNPNKLTL